MHNFITGGAGFIGHHLVNSLIEDGGTCTVLDSGRSGNLENVASDARLISSDMASMSISDFENQLEGVDVLYHLAAEKYNSSSMTPERVLDVNVSSTERLFFAAKNVGVKRVVFTSSLYAYGSLGPNSMSESDLPQPWTHYGISKLTGEQLLNANFRKSPVTWNAARLFFIYGPRQFANGGYKSVIQVNFERLLRGERVLINGDGQQKLDYVFVDDCVNALKMLASSETSGEVVNISSGISHTVQTVLEKMCSVAGKAFEPEYLPPDWTAGSDRRGNKDKMLETFKWEPSTGMDQGLGEIWKWLKNR
jgi:UDP-glucose 4-epimerase